MIKFPNRFMKKSELIKMCLSRQYLERIYKTNKDVVAIRISMTNPHSAIIFDTESLAKVIENERKITLAGMN